MVGSPRPTVGSPRPTVGSPRPTVGSPHPRDLQRGVPPPRPLGEEHVRRPAVPARDKEPHLLPWGELGTCRDLVHHLHHQGAALDPLAPVATVHHKDAIPIGWLLTSRAGGVRALHPVEGQAQPVGRRQDKLLGPGWGQHAASPRHGGAGLPPQIWIYPIYKKKSILSHF